MAAQQADEADGRLRCPQLIGEALEGRAASENGSGTTNAWRDRRENSSRRQCGSIPKERATLIRLLIDTLDAESEEGSDDAWRAGVERRIVELDAGAVETVPWKERRARLCQR